MSRREWRPFSLSAVCSSQSFTGNYLACQGFCHPLKWSQRLFDRKFYPDFRIRPNVPRRFFFCSPQAHNVYPGTRNQSVYCYHYCLITTNLRPSHPCPPILVIQSNFYSLSSMRPLKMSLVKIPEKSNAILSRAPRQCDIKIKQAESACGWLCDVHKDIRYCLHLWSVVCKGVRQCYQELSSVKVKIHVNVWQKSCKSRTWLHLDFFPILKHLPD